MKTDKQLLVITHLSQLVPLIIGFGNLIVPLILWFTQKDRVYQMDAHGKTIVNFQLSLIVLYIVCAPLILLFGLGFLGFLILWLASMIYPVINAIKVSNNQTPEYPFSFNFIN